MRPSQSILQAVEELNVSDNEIASMPGSWEGLRACKLMWLYGNQLKSFPAALFQLPKLECELLESHSQFTRINFDIHSSQFKLICIKA